uniref:Peroxidase 52 n=1 Tax=Arundo donax TaxID=35708 RepID=A0A0A9H8H0_ARUDO
MRRHTPGRSSRGRRVGGWRRPCASPWRWRTASPT